MPQTTALRLTGAIDTFIAAMDQPRDSPEVEAAVAQVREWAGTTIEWADDYGGTLPAHEVGSLFPLSVKKGWSITFSLKGDAEYQPFTHLGVLIDGLENGVDQGGSRARSANPLMTPTATTPTSRRTARRCSCGGTRTAR